MERKKCLLCKSHISYFIYLEIQKGGSTRQHKPDQSLIETHAAGMYDPKLLTFLCIQLFLCKWYQRIMNMQNIAQILHVHTCVFCIQIRKQDVTCPQQCPPASS